MKVDSGSATEFPQSWQATYLKNVVEAKRPITYGVVKAGEYDENGSYLVRAQDYSSGWVQPEKLFKISEVIEKSYKRSRIKTGDLLLTLIGSVGNIAIVPNWLDGANITRQTARLAANPELCNTNFLYNYLNFTQTQHEIYRHTKSGVQAALTLKDVGNFVVPLPPLPEQRKIAAILSTWDEAITLTERLIEALRQRKQALMQLLLTGEVRFKEFRDEEWHVGQFIDFLELQRGFDLPTGQRIEGDIKIIASNGFVGFHNAGIEGPGVVTGRSGTIGKVFYEEQNYWPLNTTLFVRDFNGNLPLFSYYFLQWFGLERFGSGTGVPTLNRNDVHPTDVSYPSLGEQVKISEVLQVSDIELSVVEKYLGWLQTQKRGLMQQLLTGAIRVRVDE